MPTSSTFMASPRPCSLIPLSLLCTSTRLTWHTCLLTTLTSRRLTLSHRIHPPCPSLHPISLALQILTGAPLQQASTPVPACQDIPTLTCPPTWAVTTKSVCSRSHMPTPSCTQKEGKEEKSGE